MSESSVERNGSGNKALITLVVAVIAHGALTAWAGSGTKALEKAQALEVQLAVERTERESMKRDIAEIKDTTKAIWKAMEERRERGR